MKFCGRVGCVTRTNWLDFGEDPNPDPTTRILKLILHHWEIGPKTICSTTSQIVADGFGRNLVDTLGARQGRIDSILMIRIRIQLLEFLSDSSPLRDWAKQPNIQHDISKSCGRIRMKFGEQVGWVIRMNWLDFGEDPDPDLTSRII